MKFPLPWKFQHTKGYFTKVYLASQYLILESEVPSLIHLFIWQNTPTEYNLSVLNQI